MGSKTSPGEWQLGGVEAVEERQKEGFMIEVEISLLSPRVRRKQDYTVMRAYI